MRRRRRDVEGAGGVFGVEAVMSPECGVREPRCFSRAGGVSARIQGT